MAEAEDVLIEAAERVTAATRALWARDGASRKPAAAVELAALRPTLQVLVRACFGRELPIVATDPAPAPGRLARTFGGLPPWRERPGAPAFTDGARLFLPRRLPRADGEEAARALYRATALGLVARLARDSLAHCPVDPRARDAYWAADGALGDCWLAGELPGLAHELAGVREAALAARPSLRTLSAAEQRSEDLVRRLLAGDPERALADAGLAPGARTPATIAHWAEAWAAAAAADGGYRGVAPVAHWGDARPGLDASGPTAGASRREPADEGRRPSRGRRLDRRIETRHDEPDEDEAPGPILLASEDGHLSVQDPAGLRRPRDQGLDEPLDLEALAEEFARLPEARRVREPGAVGEILEADDEGPRASAGAAPPADVRGAGVLYPEWDHRIDGYRSGHCVVREVAAAEGDPGWAEAVRRDYAALLARVQRLFEALRPRRERRRRQLDGDDLDLDAFVADHADRRAGLPPSDRLYTDQRPHRRDVAISFLVDASGSTDAWVGGGKSVLEVEKAAILVLCEALRALGDRHAIHAFSGEGPKDVRVLRLQGFDEAPGAATARIAGLAPDRFTRLGAPLRHLTAALARQAARQRLLLLLSDGKPNDDDEYEGRYGVEDTRRAVVEARLLGIEVFCLTVDREGSVYLPRMFGPFGYAVLPEVRQLPERLVDLYRRLTAAGA